MKTDGLCGLIRREALGYWLAANGLTEQGAEVGCAYGANAAQILSQWQGARLWMVDPWSPRPAGEYLEVYNDRPEWFEQCYRDCQSLAEQYPIVKMIRLTSIEAAPTFLDGQLDWVYIDGAHDYRNVLADMDVWWPKVKRGGLFGGHDFYNAQTPEATIQVEDAVKRWTIEHAMPYTVTPCSSWWIRKP